MPLAGQAASWQAASPQAASQPASLYQQIWAEVQAERAASRGDGVIGTMAAGSPATQEAPSRTLDATGDPIAPDAARKPDLADTPADPELASDAPIADIADVPPDRDLIDASAAFTTPRG